MAVENDDIIQTSDQEDDSTSTDNWIYSKLLFWRKYIIESVDDDHDNTTILSESQIIQSKEETQYSPFPDLDDIIDDNDILDTESKSIDDEYIDHLLSIMNNITIHSSKLHKFFISKSIPKNFFGRIIEMSLSNHPPSFVHKRCFQKTLSTQNAYQAEQSLFIVLYRLSHLLLSSRDFSSIARQTLFTMETITGFIYSLVSFLKKEQLYIFHKFAFTRLVNLWSIWTFSIKHIILLSHTKCYILLWNSILQKITSYSIQITVTFSSPSVDILIEQDKLAALYFLDKASLVNIISDHYSKYMSHRNQQYDRTIANIDNLRHIFIPSQESLWPFRYLNILSSMQGSLRSSTLDILIQSLHITLELQVDSTIHLFIASLLELIKDILQHTMLIDDISTEQDHFIWSVLKWIKKERFIHSLLIESWIQAVNCYDTKYPDRVISKILMSLPITVTDYKTTVNCYNILYNAIIYVIDRPISNTCSIVSSIFRKLYSIQEQDHQEFKSLWNHHILKCYSLVIHKIPLLDQEFAFNLIHPWSNRLSTWMNIFLQHELDNRDKQFVLPPLFNRQSLETNRSQVLKSYWTSDQEKSLYESNQIELIDAINNGLIQVQRLLTSAYLSINKNNQKCISLVFLRMEWIKGGLSCSTITMAHSIGISTIDILELVLSIFEDLDNQFIYTDLCKQVMTLIGTALVMRKHPIHQKQYSLIIKRLISLLSYIACILTRTGARSWRYFLDIYSPRANWIIQNGYMSLSFQFYSALLRVNGKQFIRHRGDYIDEFIQIWFLSIMNGYFEAQDRVLSCYMHYYLSNDKEFTCDDHGLVHYLHHIQDIMSILGKENMDKIGEYLTIEQIEENARKYREYCQSVLTSYSSMIRTCKTKDGFVRFYYQVIGSMLVNFGNILYSKGRSSDCVLTALMNQLDLNDDGIPLDDLLVCLCRLDYKHDSFIRRCMIDILSSIFGRLSLESWRKDLEILSKLTMFFIKTDRDQNGDFGRFFIMSLVPKFTDKERTCIIVLVLVRCWIRLGYGNKDVFETIHKCMKLLLNMVAGNDLFDFGSRIACELYLLVSDWIYVLISRNCYDDIWRKWTRYLICGYGRAIMLRLVNEFQPKSFYGSLLFNDIMEDKPEWIIDLSETFMQSDLEEEIHTSIIDQQLNLDSEEISIPDLQELMIGLSAFASVLVLYPYNELDLLIKIMDEIRCIVQRACNNIPRSKKIIMDQYFLTISILGKSIHPFRPSFITHVCITHEPDRESDWMRMSGFD